MKKKDSDDFKKKKRTNLVLSQSQLIQLVELLQKVSLKLYSIQKIFIPSIMVIRMKFQASNEWEKYKLKWF